MLEPAALRVRARGAEPHLVAFSARYAARIQRAHAASAAIAVRLPGHTPGSIGLFIRLRPDLELFHVGDAVVTLSQLASEADKPPFLRRTDYDPETTRETVALLHDLQLASPELVILPGHDRPAYRRAFGAPGACLVP
jgi:glyoxylase-like metal-dependent hydrolase (beta-lactamase superfamily II)